MSKKTAEPHDDHGPFRESAIVRVRGAERRSPTATPRRRRSVPVVRVSNYTDADWEAESFALFAEGADPAPCPECGMTGFFGPRVYDEIVKCRACRFCGFWQQTNEAPLRQLPTVHGCTEWPTVSKMPYIWWVLPSIDHYDCPFCGENVDVPVAIVMMPVDEADHPWRRIPQQRSHAFYQRLWNNWPATAGRTIL